MSLVHQLFSKRFWDSSSQPNCISFSDGYDLCVMLGETLHVYIPMYDATTSFTFNNHWLNVSKSELRTSETIENQYEIENQEPSKIRWVRQYADSNSIKFKCVEWLPHVYGYPAKYLLTVLFDDGSLHIVDVHSQTDNDFAFESHIGTDVLCSSNGVTSVISFNGVQGFYKSVTSMTWLSTQLLFANNKISSSVLIASSAQEIFFWKVDSCVSETFNRSSLDADGHLSQFGIGGLTMISSHHCNIESGHIANIKIISELPSYLFPLEDSDSQLTCQLLVSSSEGTIFRCEVTFTYTDNMVHTSYEEIWKVLAFESSVDIISNPFGSFTCVLIASAGYFAVLNYIAGTVIYPSSNVLDHNISGLSYIDLSLHSTADARPDNVNIMVSSLSGKIALYQYSEGDEPSLVLINEIKPFQEYISSFVIDPMHLSTIFLISFPPSFVFNRETQLNSGLRASYSEVFLLPLSRAFATHGTFDFSKSLYDAMTDCFLGYKRIFSTILKRFCLRSDDVDSTRFVTLPLKIFELAKLFVIDPFPEGWANDLGINTSEAIERIKERHSQYMSVKGNKMTDSMIADEDPTDDDDDNDEEDDEPSVKKKRNSHAKSNTVKNVESKQSFKMSKKERKTKFGGAGIKRLTAYAGEYPSTRILQTLHCFLAASIEVSVLINAKQAKTSEIVLPATDDEAIEVLMRLPTDTIPLRNKLLLWRACVIVFQSLFVMTRFNESEIDQRFPMLREQFQELIVVSEAILSLKRATELALLNLSYSTRLTAIEKHSLYRRCAILQAYAQNRRSSHLIASAIASSASTIFQFSNPMSNTSSSSNDNNIGVDEVCFVCESGRISFDPKTPLESTCSECLTTLNRCFFTYEILNFSSTLSNEIESSTEKNSVYRAANRFLICPLCRLGCLNLDAIGLIKERRTSSSMVMDLDVGEVFDWLNGRKSTHVCPFCTETMSLTDRCIDAVMRSLDFKRSMQVQFIEIGYWKLSTRNRLNINISHFKLNQRSPILEIIMRRSTSRLHIAFFLMVKHISPCTVHRSLY